MTFRVTGKESLLGGPPPEDPRRGQWIREERALFESAGRSDTARRDARREQRVREDYQGRVASSERARAERIAGYWAGVRAGDIQHTPEP